HRQRRQAHLRTQVRHRRGRQDHVLDGDGSAVVRFPVRGDTMLRATILFAVGLCANVLIGLPAMEQAPAEVTLTRIDCGTGATPNDVGQRFTDTYAYKDLKLTFTYSCYLIKHGGDYMVWDTGFTPGTSPNA